VETNELQVSRNIKSCRERTGMTQEAIANILGITKQTYLSIENNPMNYSINKLNSIANAIGCNIDEFFLQNQFTNSEKNNKYKRGK